MLSESKSALARNSFFVEGHHVRAILFRCPPDSRFSRGFQPEDRRFCDAEVGAVWLAASHLDSVLAINRYDPAAWFLGPGWSPWLEMLTARGVPVTPLSLGLVDATSPYWYPYSGSDLMPSPSPSVRASLGAAASPRPFESGSVVIAGQVLEGPTQPTVLEAAKVLWESGIGIAEVRVDSEGRVLGVDPQPNLRAGETVNRAADILAGLYRDHLLDR